MSKELVTLPSIANMDACKKALQTDHNNFPVLNTAGKLVGLIPKSFVIKIIEKKAFYDKERTDRSGMVEEDKLNEILADNNGTEPLIDTNDGSPQGDSQLHGLTYDENNGFPRTPHNDTVDWREFSCDIFSTDADA